VLSNGRVAAKLRPARDALTTQLDQAIPVDRSGWIALRAVGPARGDVKGESLYAHTSPVYISVAGRPAGSAEDARYFLAWINRLWDTVEERDRIPGADLKAEVQSQIDRARAVYRKIIEQGGGEEGTRSGK
jgi:hypothetical protein